MSNIVTINNIGVELSTNNNKAYSSTLDIAKVFGKNHKHVLEAVDKTVELLPEMGRNFDQSFYNDSYGREQKMYILDRDMFTLVAMGFTGVAAMQWKAKYVNAFNKMEEEIIKQQKLLLTAELNAKDEVIKQLTSTRKSYKKIIENNEVYISANGLASDEAFTAKSFRAFMKSLNLVSQQFKLTGYWEATEYGLESGLVVNDENGTPYYNLPKCKQLYKDMKLMEDEE